MARLGRAYPAHRPLARFPDAATAAVVAALPAGAVAFTPLTPTVWQALLAPLPVGSATFMGQAPGLVVSGAVVLPVGGLTLTGLTPAALVAYLVVPSVGAVAVTGQAAALLTGMPLAGGSLGVTGQPLSLLLGADYLLVPGVGALAFTGRALVLSVAAPGASSFPSDLNTVFIRWMETNLIYGDVNTQLRDFLATAEGAAENSDLTTLLTQYDLNTAPVAGGLFRELEPPARLSGPQLVVSNPTPPTPSRLRRAWARVKGWWPMKRAA